VEVLLSVEEVLPSLDRTIKGMGYRANSMEPYFIVLAQKGLENAGSLIVPRGIYVEYELEAVSRNEGYFIIGDRKFYPGPRILDRLATARYIVAFAVTIGAEIGLRIRGLAEQGASVEAYMLDFIAGLAADNVAEAVQRRAETDAATRGLGCTERFSPGYCGWPVAAQKTLFSLLPPNPCGISLNASSMMTPEKSVSGVFGTGPGMGRKAYGCGGCDKENCPERRRMT
jgi:hypothetical protein